MIGHIYDKMRRRSLIKYIYTKFVTVNCGLFDEKYFNDF